MSGGKQISMVLDAAQSGYCNTTRDIADVTGLSVAICSNYVSELIRLGLLKRVDRTIPNINPVNSGRRHEVFRLILDTGRA